MTGILGTGSDSGSDEVAGIDGSYFFLAFSSTSLLMASSLDFLDAARHRLGGMSSGFLLPAYLRALYPPAL